jgi:hypothetical protein
MAGDAGEAERWGRSAVEHATRSDFVGLQAEANLALARALFMQGRGDDARAAATRALQLFQGMEDLPGAAAAAQMMEGRDLEETAPLVRSGTQGGAGTRRSLRGR